MQIHGGLSIAFSGLTLLGDRKGIWPVKKLIVGMLVVASVAHPVVSAGTVIISNNITAIKSSDVK